jgi:hypothetical protein
MSAVILTLYVKGAQRCHSLRLHAESTAGSRGHLPLEGEEASDLEECVGQHDQDEARNPRNFALAYV